MADNSSSISSNILPYNCINSTAVSHINCATVVIRTIVTLPLCTLVLYLGHQRWRQQRAFKTTSHSDVFTYHMAAINLIWGFVCFCYIYGTYAHVLNLIVAGMSAASLVFYGETLLHVLTCVDRYLAVVHPITYMGLKNERGVKIRNISVVCVWLLSFVMLTVTTLYLPELPIVPSLVIVCFTLIVVSFCSLSVLWVLNRPGPGEGGGEKPRVDRSKQRAFHTIIAILGVLASWFVGLIVSTALTTSPQLSSSVSCAVLASMACFNLPSNLMIPLLYLHRAGKLSCCCCNISKDI